MKKRSLSLLVLFALVLTMLLGACQATEEPAAPAAEGGRQSVNIYAVSHGACAWDSYWCVVEKGSEEAAADLGVEVTLLTTDKFDLEATAQNIDRAVAANPDALMVTVTDAVLFEEPIMRAIDAGIPVIAYDSWDIRPRGERIPYLTAVGPNEYTAGYQAADRFVNAHGGTAGVCINQQVGHALLDLRCQGFADRLAEDGIPSEMLGISDDPAQSTSVISDYYTANPDTDLFLTLGPNGADPFYAFMEAAGLSAGDIAHGTFDLSPEIVEKVKDGTTDYAIDGGPYLVGYLPVMWLTMIERYGLYPPDELTATGPSFVDKTNIDMVSELAGTYR
jgi:simple sugar transport system substrate-binding protein